MSNREVVFFIEKGDVHPYNFFSKDFNFFTDTTFNVQTQLLEKALNNLENDITNLVESIKTDRYQDYFWKFTYKDHRNDAVKATVLDYYIFEIIKYITTNFNVKKIIILSKLNQPLINKVVTFSPVEKRFKETTKTKITNLITKQFGPIKYLLGYIKHLFRFKTQVTSIKKEFIVFITNNSFHTVRYRNFPEKLSEHKDVYYLNMSFTKLKHHLSKKEFLVKSYSFGIFIRAFFKAINLFFLLKSNSKNVNTIYAFTLINQSFLQTFYLTLRYLSIKRFFNIYKPSCSIVATTVGDTKNRMILSIAKEMNMKTVVFSCRPVLSYLRAEDRVMQLDFKKEKSFFFTDYFIVFDKISKNHLIDANVDSNKIAIYKEPVATDNNKSKTFSKGFLVLFAYHLYNDKIITLLSKIVAKEGKFATLFYREHPSLKIRDKQLNKLKKLSNSLVCITNEDWKHIHFKDIIAISADSTSGIVASSRRSSIVWLPFLSVHSLSFKPMYKAIGRTCYNEKEFYDFIENSKNDGVRDDFHQQCNAEYKKNVDEKSDIEDLVEKLTK